MWLRGAAKGKDPFVQASVTNVQQNGCAIFLSRRPAVALLSPCCHPTVSEDFSALRRVRRSHARVRACVTFAVCLSLHLLLCTLLREPPSFPPGAFVSSRHRARITVERLTGEEETLDASKVCAHAHMQHRVMAT